MDVLNFLTIIAAISYFGITIYTANYEQATGERAALVRALLYGVIAIVFFFALTTLQAAILPLPIEAGVQLPQPDLMGAVVNFAFALVVCFFSLRVVNSPNMRMWLKNHIGGQASYNPDSSVHTTAIVLSLALLSFTIGQLVLSGGISGMAESIETSGISVGDTVFNQVLWIILAFLGIGLFLRRTPQQAFERLALRAPTTGDIRAGLSVGVAMYGFVLIFSLLWAALVSPELFQEQTAASEQIAQAFSTLPLALLLAVAAAVGEEILFRGALQPVFGLWLTSIFFALLHTQYTLTPASLTIFVVALALGWLRQRHSTSAAIIGHFIYNFVLLALPLLFGSLAGG
jgi:membrane protease YdiL (CAAX protease family)